MMCRAPRLLYLALPAVVSLELNGTNESTLNKLSGEYCHKQGGQEFCNSLQVCLPDSHCEKCDGYLTEDVDSHECIDRQVFSSHLAADISAAVIWFLGAGLAMSAGVGGGGIFVPLGVILLRFSSKPSTGLSQASIFGASLAGLLINIRGRHPKADRPVIDLDMALFLAPMEMAGALLGVIIQKVLPVWAVILLMASILGFTAYKTYVKGFKTLKKECAARKKRKTANGDAGNSGEKTVTDTTADIEKSTSEPAKPASEPDGLPPKLAWGDMTTAAGRSTAPALDEQHKKDLPSVEQWLAEDAKVPLRNCGLLLLMWVFLIALLVVQGGKGTAGLVEYCSVGYWLCTVLSFLWLFGFSLCTGYMAVSKSIQKVAVGYPFVEGDVVWSWSKFRLYCCLTLIAGVVAGLIGIGGGMVLGPMMLQLGVLPQVSSATTATMIVLTSSVAALMYVTAGSVPISYAAVFFMVAFLGAFAGKMYIDRLVKKLQLTAIIVLILATIIAFASVMMTINGVVIYNDRGWVFEGLTDVC